MYESGEECRLKVLSSCFPPPFDWRPRSFFFQNLIHRLHVTHRRKSTHGEKSILLAQLWRHQLVKGMRFELELFFHKGRSPRQKDASRGRVTSPNPEKTSRFSFRPSAGPRWLVWDAASRSSEDWVPATEDRISVVWQEEDAEFVVCLQSEGTWTGEIH